MTTSTLRDAVYELGIISHDGTLTNLLLLERLADLLAESIDAGLVAVGVFDHGIDHPSTACVVRGPWTNNRPTPLPDKLFWAIGDQSLARRLAGLRRGRLYHRPEFTAELNGSSSRLFESIDRCLGSDDQAIALFRRTDGIELLIGIHSAAGQGPLHRSTLQKAGALAPFVARCWASNWQHEPEWVGRLNKHGREVLGGVMRGYDDDQIAQDVGLSYHSVRAHLKRMFKAADVRSRLHLMQACCTCGHNGHTLELCQDQSSTSTQIDGLDLTASGGLSVPGEHSPTAVG